MLLAEQEKPPDGPGWVHEIKWDGYRVQTHLQGGKATICTRRGNDWTRQFRWIADAVANLPAKRAIIDGEAVVLGENRLADFHLLRGALDGRSRRLRLQAFDLLALDGADLRKLPLVDRKTRLKELLVGAPPALAFVDHMTGDSAQILRHVLPTRHRRHRLETCRVALRIRSVVALGEGQVRAQHLRGRELRGGQGPAAASAGLHHVCCEYVALPLGILHVPPQ